MIYERKPLTNFAAWDVLRVLLIAERAMTAKEISAEIHAEPDRDPRSYSASMAQLAWELVRRGYAERKLRRRELYEYVITDAGRAAWLGHIRSTDESAP